MTILTGTIKILTGIATKTITAHKNLAIATVITKTTIIATNKKEDAVSSTSSDVAKTKNGSQNLTTTYILSPIASPRFFYLKYLIFSKFFETLASSLSGFSILKIESFAS